MSFHNTYNKTCPRCALSVAQEVAQCACGHVFTPSGPSHSLATLQAALQEEELYLDYLSARAKQAAHAAVVAQSVYASNRGDVNEAERARRALEVADAARAEVLAQKERMAKLARAIAGDARKTERAATGVPARSVTAGSVPLSSSSPAAPPPPKTPASAKLALNPVPRQDVAMKSCPVCTARVKADIRACTCGFSFQPVQLQNLDIGAASSAEAGRARLAREAERALQRARAAKAVSDDAAAAGRARLTREAELALQRSQAGKPRECPHCTALVPANATRCVCGYAVDGGRAGKPMPALTLDPAEQAKLGELFKRK